jgi:DNA-directed RNA polymerase specialized sigma24 family protein
VLDYYEVHFNSAFAVLRTGVIRDELTRVMPLESVTRTDTTAPDKEDEDSTLPELEDLSKRADVVLSAQNHELHRLIQQLPPAERAAVLWKYFYDLKTESADPAETTVASLCGVSGSEIRSRLRTAYARLKNRMEEKKS